MNMKWYILDSEHNVKEVTIEEYREFVSVFNNRIVKKDKIGDIEISTVFLSIDHSFNGGKPILFETMIFGGIHDQYQDRCSTWDEALKMHQVAVDLITREA